MGVIYVLELVNSKYYVGQTNDLEARLQEHRDGRGAAWTSLHPMVKCLFTFDSNEISEQQVTEMMMTILGPQNVRGGRYCKIEPSHSEDSATMRYRYDKNRCYNCGGAGHYSSNCYWR